MDIEEIAKKELQAAILKIENNLSECQVALGVIQTFLYLLNKNSSQGEEKQDK